MLLEIGIIIGGCIAYQLLDDKTPRDKSQTRENQSSYVTEVECNMQATKKYWDSLSLAEQEYYFNNNLDLRDYKEQLFTDCSYFNAKHVVELSRRLNKPFTNKYKTY